MEFRNIMQTITTNERESRDLYNVLGAIRGNDDCIQSKYKVVTVAIRSYVGFNRDNCNGDTLARDWKYHREFNLGLESQRYDLVKYEDFANALCQFIEDIANENTPESTTHYITHLYYAIKAIGLKKLQTFIRELKPPQ